MSPRSSKKSPASEKTRISYVQLGKLLNAAIAKRIPSNEKFGIAFSGGLDSGLLAFCTRKLSKKAILLTVGTKGSPDLVRAAPLVKKWKMKWAKKELSHEMIAESYALAGKILKKKDHLQQTLGAVDIAIAQLAKEEGIYTLFVGSGADELFCGYGAFDSCRGNEKKCERLRAEKMKNIHAHDVKREEMCAAHFGISIHAPYLDEAFAAEALRVPALYNLEGKYGKWRKNALRMLAEKAGAPREIVTAPKKAMQYGSGTQKALEKITQ